MSDGYEVLTDELDTHAGKVDGLAQRLQTAVQAAQQVAMDNSAYGVICQPFALLLDPFEQMGVRALQSAQESVGDTAGQVRDAVQTYTAQDQSTGQVLDTIGKPLID
ncbi:type VII secretion target [Amycolatopsis sp. GM8]|uniref:type VII secretion target n=1 Tax=Amycolatopsis sp. GM8 TaxID=2896530 RepID=UPI001F1FA93B|nr:type VII secretion target [Amycolatopsis sp. GM8]